MTEEKRISRMSSKMEPNWAEIACEYQVGNQYEFTIRVASPETRKFTEQSREYYEKIPYIFIIKRWNSLDEKALRGWAVKGGGSWLDAEDLDFYVNFDPQRMIFPTKELAWEAYQKWFAKEWQKE
jgi:hypothetical protein